MAAILLLAFVMPGVLLSADLLRSRTPSALNLEGHTQALLTARDHLVVLIFVATDCPICNRYLPEIERIRQVFAHRPVRLWIVYANPDETAEGVRHQLAVYHLQLPALLDPGQRIAAFAHAHVTPEAAVFLPTAEGALREVYRGRIDDRYTSFGHEKPEATSHELEAAIVAALDGKPVRPAAGHPVGCVLVPASHVAAMPRP